MPSTLPFGLWYDLPGIHGVIIEKRRVPRQLLFQHSRYIPSLFIYSGETKNRLDFLVGLFFFATGPNVVFTGARTHVTLGVCQYKDRLVLIVMYKRSLCFRPPRSGTHTYTSGRAEYFTDTKGICPCTAARMPEQYGPVCTTVYYTKFSFGTAVGLESRETSQAEKRGRERSSRRAFLVPATRA